MCMSTVLSGRSHVTQVEIPIPRSGVYFFSLLNAMFFCTFQSDNFCVEMLYLYPSVLSFLSSFVYNTVKKILKQHHHSKALATVDKPLVLSA